MTVDIMDMRKAALQSAHNNIDTVSTTFSLMFIEANTWVAKALEADGAKLQQFLNTALICAKEAESAAYEHNVVEKIAAANLVNTINTLISVWRG